MIILGIDPGYAIVGYGIIKYEKNKFTVLDFGAITTPANVNFSDRLMSIYDDLEYEHEADIFANQQKYVKPLLPYEIIIARNFIFFT